MGQPDPDPWMTDKEVAARLRITPGGLRNLRHRGLGPRWAKSGRSVLYRVSAVAEYEHDIELAGQKAREEALSFQHRGAA